MQKPSIIKNVLLLSPGIWNETEYTAEEIVKSFNNTDWNDKKNRNLFLDHQDTKERGVGNWVGYISNPRLEKGSELWGDLEIWNPLVSSYLKEAKAPFGISATLAGLENLDNKSEGAKGRMENFHYESFSVVTDPACKNAHINLSQSNKITVVTLSQKNSDDIEEEVDDLDLDDEEEELSKNNQSDTDLSIDNCKEVKMEEEAKKLEEISENKVEEKIEENKCEEMPEEAKKKKKYEEEMMSSMKTDIDSLKLTLQSLQAEISKLVSVKENEVKVEVKEDVKENLEALELEKVKKELNELREEFGRPVRKTMSFEDGSSFSGDSNEAMLGFLQDRLY